MRHPRVLAVALTLLVGVTAASAAPITLATYTFAGTIDSTPVTFNVPGFVPDDLSAELSLKTTFLIDDVSPDALLETPPGPYQRHVANTRYCAPAGCLDSRFTYEEIVTGPFGAPEFVHDLTISGVSLDDILVLVGVADAFAYHEILATTAGRTDVLGTLTLTGITPGTFPIDTVPEVTGLEVPVPVPEPASLMLLAAGLLLVRRRH